MTIHFNQEEQELLKKRISPVDFILNFSNDGSLQFDTEDKALFFSEKINDLYDFYGFDLRYRLTHEGAMYETILEKLYLHGY